MRREQDMAAALRGAGMRLTRQRAAILKALAASTDHPDAHALLERARRIEPDVSLATVYRALSALSESGLVEKHAFEGPSARFESADAPHHDHIVDLDSGALIEFVSPEIERLQKDVARQHGYEVESHRLVLYCRRRRD